MAVAQVIEEIPIEAQDIPENTHWGEDIQETTEEIQEHINSTDDIPKKGRGRPAGAKNKPKPKPAPAAAKPKAKSKAKKPIEYEESESEEEEAPPPRRRGRQVSGIQPPLTLTHEREREVEFDRHALAADVLGILQQQRYQRTTAKRNHYASWFENMQ